MLKKKRPAVIQSSHLKRDNNSSSKIQKLYLILIILVVIFAILITLIIILSEKNTLKPNPQENEFLLGPDSSQEDISVHLKWDKTDLNIAGYFLYYWKSDSLVNKIDLKDISEIYLDIPRSRCGVEELNNQISNQYFLYLTSYNSQGIESVPSNTLTYNPEPVSLINSEILAGLSSPNDMSASKRKFIFEYCFPKSTPPHYLSVIEQHSFDNMMSEWTEVRGREIISQSAIDSDFVQVKESTYYNSEFQSSKYKVIDKRTLVFDVPSP